MSTQPATSEDRPLLQDTTKNDHARPTWISLSLFLALQVLSFVAGEAVIGQLSMQFVRSRLAKQHGFPLPKGYNACVDTNQSSVLLEIESETALFSTYQSFLMDLIPVLTGLPLVALSDYTGRRPILIQRCLGSLALASSFLLVSFFDLSLYVLLIGCTLFGLSGGFVLMYSIGMLYVTDIVSPSVRGLAITAVYGTQYSVMYIAPLVLNTILEAVDSFTIIFLIVECFALVAFIYMLPRNLIRETVPKQPVDTSLVSNMASGIRDVFAYAVGGRRWRLIVILACYCSIGFILHGFQNTVNLYGLGQPFCWTPTLVGVFAFVYGAPNAIISPFVVWILEFFVSDFWAIYLSIFSQIAEVVLTAVATTTAVLIYGASIAGIFAGTSQPLYVALLTKLVPSKRHGGFFAIHTLLFALTAAMSLIAQSYAFSIAVKSGHAKDIFFVLTAITGIVFFPTLLVHVLEPEGGFHPDAIEEHNNVDESRPSDEHSQNGTTQIEENTTSLVGTG